MDRFPHKCIIMKPVQAANNPYSELSVGDSYVQVYKGRCRCFLLKAAALRVGKIMDCDYKVVFQDRSMIEIGENWKIAIKFQNTTNDKTWDIVGFVKDFARYDRVCEVYFQMMKENIIYEDIPQPAKDVDPAVFGLDMDYIRFNTEDDMDTSHGSGVELPLWVLFGDWSRKVKWTETFAKCKFKRYSFENMSACESLDSTFNSAKFNSISLPQELPNCHNMDRTFDSVCTLDRKAVDITIPICENLIGATKVFRKATIGTLTFKGNFKVFGYSGEGASAPGGKIDQIFEDADIENIVFYGEINSQDMSKAFVGCDLSHECIESILQALGECENPDDSTYNKLGFSQECVDKMTDSDKKMITDKGWVLVSQSTSNNSGGSTS